MTTEGMDIPTLERVERWLRNYHIHADEMFDPPLRGFEAGTRETNPTCRRGYSPVYGVYHELANCVADEIETLRAVQLRSLVADSRYPDLYQLSPGVVCGTDTHCLLSIECSETAETMPQQLREDIAKLTARMAGHVFRGVVTLDALRSWCVTCDGDTGEHDKCTDSNNELPVRLGLIDGHAVNMIRIHRWTKLLPTGDVQIWTSGSDTSGEAALKFVGATWTLVIRPMYAHCIQDGLPVFDMMNAIAD